LTRRNARKRTPADRLARLLLESYVAAYIAQNRHHDNPGWEGVSHLTRAGLVAVAEELLRRGVRPPLEDIPEPVQWISEKKEDHP
jgi:hypothetical protein